MSTTPAIDVDVESGFLGGLCVFAGKYFVATKISNAAENFPAKAQRPQRKLVGLWLKPR